MACSRIISGSYVGPQRTGKLRARTSPSDISSAGSTVFSVNRIASARSYEITIDDPKVFTRPWSQTFEMKLYPTWSLPEQVCEENNHCQGGNCTARNRRKTGEKQIDRPSSRREGVGYAFRSFQ